MSGTPYLAGNVSTAAGGATLTIPVSASVAQGDSVLVGVLVTNAASLIASVIDSQGNIYGQVAADATETGAQLYVFELDGCPGLVGGSDSIVVTWSGTTPTVQAAIAVGDNNVTGSDQIVIAHGSSTAPSSGATLALSQAEEHAIVFNAAAAGAGAITWGAPWASNVLDTETVSGTAVLSAAYQVVDATTALTGSATLATSGPWTCAIVTTEVAPVSCPFDCSDGIVGLAYSQTIDGTTGGVGSAYTWSLASGSLPPGLSLAGNVISGTPTTAGTYSFTLQASDGNTVPATSQFVQDIVIAPSSSAGLSAITLPTNLLSAADSGFESSGSTWTADSNASAPARENSAALEGSYALFWTSVADGETSIHTGYYPATPNEPYIASGYVLAPNGYQVQCAIEWYNGTTLLSTTTGPACVATSLQWQPVTVAGVAPAAATQCKIVALSLESNAADLFAIDLFFLAQTDVQVLIDWVNAPYSPSSPAGNAFMDVSPWVRMDNGITLARGRQDAISEIQTGSFSFQLQNDSGMFTNEKGLNLPVAIGGMITTQRRCQISFADETGAWHTRSDGPISQPQYSFENTGNTSVCTVAGQDVLAYLNRGDTLSCWTREQVLADGPLLHWALDDTGTTGGSGIAAETSGNNGPAMRLWNSDSSKTATVTWQSTAGGVETLADAAVAGQPDGSEYWTAGSDQPSSAIRGLDSGAVGPFTTPLQNVYLTPKLTAQTAQNYFTGNAGYMLQASLPPESVIEPNATGDNYTFECWFTVDPGVKSDDTLKYGPYVVMSLGSSRRSADCIVAGIYLTAGSPYNFTVASYSQPPAFVGKNFSTAPPSVTASITTSFAAETVSRPHHLIVQIAGDPAAPTVTAYLDGVSFGSSFTLAPTRVYDTFCAGGAFGGDGCWYGSLSCASVYGYTLTPAQIINHCQLGQYGMWETTTDDCVAALAGYAGIPPFWSNVTGTHSGLSLTDYQDITGSNALTSMQLYEQAEGGLLFVDASGRLNFHTRDYRMGRGAPDLYLAPDSYDATMGYSLIDQYQQNESAVTTQAISGNTTTVKTVSRNGITYLTQVTTGGGSYVNTQSQLDYGAYAVNPVSSPLELPLITWNRAASQLGLATFDFETDPHLDDKAAWAANSYADPWFLPGQLVVDLKTPGGGVTRSQVYGLDIDSLIAPSGVLPASFPDVNLSTEWIIEGVNEAKTQTSHVIQFYTSPAEPQRAWIPGDPAYGVLGTTSRVGVSQADTHAIEADGKDVAHDAGRPYWPPTFATGMNSPSGASDGGFIGALDMRGLTDNLSLLTQPPMCVVGAVAQTQSFATGDDATPQLFWDTVYVDSMGGMGAIPGYPNWYVCLVPGFYDIDASLVWGIQSGGSSGAAFQSELLVAQNGAQNLAAGSGTPVTNGEYVCVTGETPRRVVQAAYNNVSLVSTRMYLGLGDMVCVGVQQNDGSTHALSNNFGGSRMSLVWRGYSQLDDRCEISGKIDGGPVAILPTTTTYTKTYKNTATYSYYGDTVGNGAKRNTNGTVYQGDWNNYGKYGDQVAQIAMPYSTMHSDLNPGGTVVIKSVTLTAKNTGSYNSTGATLQLGYSSITPGASKFKMHEVGSPDVFEQSFGKDKTLTFTLPTSFATEFQNNGKMLVVGASFEGSDLVYSGEWEGGKNNWVMTITYTVTL